MTTRTRSPDYYSLLGVSADATIAQIKKAYRKLARQHHPDRNPGDTDAADRFKAITEAYEVLTDPVRRQAYDATRPPVTEVPRGFRTVHPLGWASGKVNYFAPTEEELLTGIQR